MINDDEQLFFDQLKDRLDEKSRLELMDRINQSPELQKKFNEYKSLNHIITTVNNVKLNPDLAAVSINKFRNKLSNSTSSYFKLKIAATGLAAIVIGYFFVTAVFFNNKPTVKSDFSDLSIEELKSILTDFDIHIINSNTGDKVDASLEAVYDEILNESYNFSLAGNEKNIMELLNTESAESFFTEGEKDELYSEILDKKIL